MNRHYLVSDLVNGEPGRMHGETVDKDWVDRYVGIETQRFFINGGWTEEYRKTRSGIITMKSTNAERTRVRCVKFTPVRD